MHLVIQPLIILIIIAAFLILSCSTKTSSEPDNGTPVIPSNPENLTGSWYEEFSLFSFLTPELIPVAIRDQEDLLYVKKCHQASWSELSKNENEFSLFGFVQYSLNEEGELFSHQNDSKELYSMRKVSNEIKTNFGEIRIEIEGEDEIFKKDNVCATFVSIVDEVKNNNIISIKLPYGEELSFISIIIHLDSKDSGIYEIDNNQILMRLSFFEILESSSNFTTYFSDSGTISILELTRTSVRGTISGVLKDIVKDIKVNAEVDFDVSFYSEFKAEND